MVLLMMMALMALTYKLQALVSGDGEVLDHIGGRVETRRENVLQPGGGDQGRCGENRSQTPP
jgi:hypothetical protein